MAIVKIGLITTLDRNIGDDFIREGICRILKEIFVGEQIEFVCINKHEPYTIYPAWHPVQLRNISDHLPIVNLYVKSIIERIFSSIGFSKFDGCDLIVQCGAPVYWPNCSKNEWAKPIWYEVLGRLCRKIPVLNLAAGSCYPWERQPEYFESNDDEKYVKAILEYCSLTTVRDRLAQKLCKSVGHEVQLLPCSAFLAAYGRKAKLLDSSNILINYMAGGGHYDWEQGIDSLQWETTIKQVIACLKKRHNIAFICHDEREFLLSQAIASDIPIFFPKTPAEYFECVSNAKFGICNRMHASVAMAGMGVPSIAVCTDTRMLMVSELGLPVHYVKNINANNLNEQVETMLNSLDIEKERLLVLQKQTWEMYLSVIQKALSSP